MRCSCKHDIEHLNSEVDRLSREMKRLREILGIESDGDKRFGFTTERPIMSGAPMFYEHSTKLNALLDYLKVEIHPIQTTMICKKTSQRKVII